MFNLEATLANVSLIRTQWQREEGPGGMRPGPHCAGGGISRSEKRLKQTCISFKRSKFFKGVETLIE